MGSSLGKLSLKMSSGHGKSVEKDTSKNRSGKDEELQGSSRSQHEDRVKQSSSTQACDFNQDFEGVDGKYKIIDEKHDDQHRVDVDNNCVGASAVSSSAMLATRTSSTSEDLNSGVGPSTSSSALATLPKTLLGSYKKRRTLKSNTTTGKRDFFGLRRSKKWPMMKLSSCTKKEQDIDSPPTGSVSCVCTGYRRRNSESDTNPQTTVSSSAHHHINLSLFNPADYPIEDEEERLRRQRAKEMAEGIELSTRFGAISLKHDSTYHQVHTQVDFVHCLVPDLKEITSCSFYWGKIDRYEAEKLLDGKVEGTFLLRDSAQEEYLFSVSFRRYGRSLHARIEQWNYSFSFDSHDPSVFSSPTVTGLIEHYKDPSSCMFFEPLLTTRLHRNFPFDLQHLARSVICSRISYDDVNSLPLPKTLKVYCKEYHYKQRVRVRQLE